MVLGLALSLLAGTEPARAQDTAAADRKVEAMIDHAKKAYGPPDSRKRQCGEQSDGEIVVCAPDHGERWRVPPTSETDPESRQALRDGLPRAPEMGRGSCKGQPGCIQGGWAPPPIYIIDLSKIPEAPEGSDADKIAKGEMAAP